MRREKVEVTDKGALSAWLALVKVDAKCSCTPMRQGGCVAEELVVQRLCWGSPVVLLRG